MLHKLQFLIESYLIGMILETQNDKRRISLCMLFRIMGKLKTWRTCKYYSPICEKMFYKKIMEKEIKKEEKYGYRLA